MKLINLLQKDDRLMIKNIAISSALHIFLVVITALTFPFIAKKPIDLPPLISIELIQITDKTNIPFAPKAKKIIEKVKEKEKLVSEQAPPKQVKKEKPDAIPLPDQNQEIVKKPEKDVQNPEKVDEEVKQVSEFEKDELFDPNNIAALIDKSKEEMIAKIEETFNKTAAFIKDFDPNRLTERLDYFGADRTKRQILLLLADHITHHRAQMLVSMRLKGIKPPKYVLYQ